MNLEENYLIISNELNDKFSEQIGSNKDVISLMDLTLLDVEASKDSLIKLSEKAILYPVAALCVMPQHLTLITPPPTVKRATVVNFPEGKDPTKQILSTIDSILSNCMVDEIDYVFPYQAYLAGEQHFALSQCQQAYQLCQQHQIRFKVILETGALPSLEQIYQLSIEVIGKGCDFLKTSTGKINQGATPSVAFAMLKAIKDSKTNCGLKISGGIKTSKQAFTYMTLAKHMLEKGLDPLWFRIGASSLLDELVSNEFSCTSSLSC